MSPLVTKLFASFARMRERLVRIARDERGIAAVEFAMLLPFMLTLYIGAVEVSRMVAADRKVTLAARTVADLAAQATTISSSDMTNILKAASAVMAPYPDAKIKVILSQVKVEADGTATINWSRHYQSEARETNEAVSVPAALKNCAAFPCYLIWGEAEFEYLPLVGGQPTDLFWKFTGSKKLSDTIFMRPRLSESVACCS
jgi:Flp pilus assembly protein TadG